jgi:hypothetical protein
MEVWGAAGPAPWRALLQAGGGFTLTRWRPPSIAQRRPAEAPAFAPGLLLSIVHTQTCADAAHMIQWLLLLHACGL